MNRVLCIAAFVALAAPAVAQDRYGPRVNGYGGAYDTGGTSGRTLTWAMAKMADIDFHTAARILERRDLDALAIVCRAAKLEPRLFLTFAMLIQEKGRQRNRPRAGVRRTV